MIQLEQRIESGTVESDKDIQRIQSIPLISALLNVICRTTGMGFVAIARVTHQRWTACTVHDELGFGLKVGDDLNLHTTLCNEVRKADQAVIIDHVAEDPCYHSHPTPALYGFQSYISVPIKKKDGTFFGTLCAIDPAPRQLNTPSVTGMFALFSDLISFHLAATDESDSAIERLVFNNELLKKATRAELKFNIAIEASELGIWEMELPGENLQYSDRFPEIFGFGRTEKPTLEEVRNNIHPADKPANTAAFEDAFKTGKLHFIGRIIWPDGSVHWIESNAKVLFDDSSTPTMIIGAVRDVTAEKNFSNRLEDTVKARVAELHEKNAELEKMNKELESFTYISGHDLQEPLRKIQSFAAMIENEQTDMPERVKDYFGRMQNAARRMQMLITDLLAYSRTSTGERNYETITLSDILSQVQEDMKEEILQKNAAVRLANDCSFSAIPFQLRQLFQNLLSNALKFSDAERQPVIDISTSTITQTDMQGIKPGAASDFCLIRFSDNGIGFENTYRDKIFQVFQRLHGRSAYTGTGIGLAIVKKITDNHQGLIQAEGRINEGASFLFTCRYSKGRSGFRVHPTFKTTSLRV